MPISSLLAAAMLVRFAAGEAAPEPASEETPDRAIALAIENRVLKSDEIQSKNLRAEASDGVAVLSGTVDNLHAANQAVEAAQHVRGVRSVVSQIVVQTSLLPEEDLKERVKRSLALRFDTGPGGLQVEIDEGSVVLLGKVNSLAEKRLAEAATASLQGVTRIENKLTISRSDQYSDEQLTEIIGDLLDHSAVLDESAIEVTVEDGVVALLGRVDNLSQKKEAVDLASLPGVTRIRDGGLTVQWRMSDGMQRRERFADLTDKKIAESIRLALKHHPLLVAFADKIKVEVERGHASLTGTVDRLHKKRAAGDVARKAIGVQGVRNRLYVEWPDAENVPSDDEITGYVQSALDRDAYLSYAEIIPRTRNAHVRLYGMVDTEFEKQRAAYLAEAQPGVVHVANYLTVLGQWHPKSDSEIKQAIQREVALLETDPHVDVSVTVKNGVPVLEGHVATWFQWQNLLRIAKKAGARRPHMDVSIHYHPAGVGPRLYVPE